MPRPTSIAFLFALVLATFSASAPATHVSARTGAADPHSPDGVQQIAVADSDSDLASAAPARLRIPSIGVDSPLALLGVDGSGALVPPTDFARAGWFSGGPVPGDVGPSVVAGHVDSADGPAVFFRLRDLVAGDAIVVERADGTTVGFTVTRADRFAKDAFPSDDVYGPTSTAELRLITCGGEFDRAAGSYRDNVVVFARMG